MDADVNLISRAIDAAKVGDVFEARGYIDMLDFATLPKEILLFALFVYIDTGDADKVEGLIGKETDYPTRKLKKQYAYTLASAAEKMGDVENAHKWYLKGFSIRYRMPEFTFDFANFLDENGNLEGAEALYKIAIRERPRYYWAHVNYANTLSLLGKEKHAIRENKRALRIDKSGVIANYNIGVSYAKLNQFDKAIKYYLNEINTPNGYIDAYYNLGIIYKDQKKYDSAKYYYLQGIEKLKKLYDKDADHNKIYLNLWYNLTCLYILEHDYKSASDCLKYLNSLNSDATSYLIKDEEAKDFIKSEEFKSLELEKGGENE